MISEVNEQPMPYVLSDAVQKAYNKIKVWIIIIFSLLKTKIYKKISRKNSMIHTLILQENYKRKGMI